MLMYLKNSDYPLQNAVSNRNQFNICCEKIKNHRGVYVSVPTDMKIFYMHSEKAGLKIYDYDEIRRGKFK